MCKNENDEEWDVKKCVKMAKQRERGGIICSPGQGWRLPTVAFSAMHWERLHCLVLHCTAVYCIAFPSTQCTESTCIALHSGVSHCIAFNEMHFEHYTSIQHYPVYTDSTIQHCSVLHSISLHWTQFAPKCTAASVMHSIALYRVSLPSVSHNFTRV